MESYLISEEILQIKPAGIFISEAILACKELLKITKKAIAKLWNTTTANLSKYLNGERSLSVELALKIGSTLNLPAALLLNIELKNELLIQKNKKDYKSEFALEQLTKG